MLALHSSAYARALRAVFSAVLLGTAISGCERPGIHVTHVYVVTPAGNAPAVLYADVKNTTAFLDTLLSLSTPVATRAELHESMTMPMEMPMTETHGTSESTAHAMSKMPMSSVTMRPVAGIPVAPGMTVALAPGGYHAMLIGPGPLVRGESVSVIWRFAHAGTVATRAAVIGYADLDTTVHRNR